jgi:hypothetical protein
MLYVMGSKGFTHEAGPYNENVEWYTPRSVFDASGVRVDLAPCSPGGGKCFVPALKHYTVEDDGLRQPWGGFVWCNPPYGRHTRVWLERMRDHGDGIALVFSRTGSSWFQEVAHTASSVVFVSGRIKFVSAVTGEPAGSAGADSVLLGWGSMADEALLWCGLGLHARLQKVDLPSQG